jgi:hypothetical protein
MSLHGGAGGELGAGGAGNEQQGGDGDAADVHTGQNAGEVSA